MNNQERFSEFGKYWAQSSWICGDGPKGSAAPFTDEIRCVPIKWEGNYATGAICRWPRDNALIWPHLRDGGCPGSSARVPPDYVEKFRHKVLRTSSRKQAVPSSPRRKERLRHSPSEWHVPCGPIVTPPVAFAALALQIGFARFRHLASNSLDMA